MGTVQARLQKLQTWARAHGALTGLIGLILGTALGIAIPIWQTYWVETPRLSIEIYSIDRQITSDARISADDDTLSVLAARSSGASSEVDSRVVRRGGYTTNEAAELIARAKSEQRALPARIEERTRALREVDALTPDRITPADVDRFNLPILREFDMAAGFTLPTVEGAAERQRAITFFRKAYMQRLEEAQKRYAELQAQLPAAERRIDELKKDLEAKKAFFQITAIISNSGRKSVSIRQLALFRVYIGKGNYVDLRLNLKDYEKNAQIDANGTRLAIFTSDPIEALPEADRYLVATYWGQSVHGVFFTEDITGSIHASNGISFAKGLYIKEVFDRLSNEASSAKYLRSND